MTIKLTPVRIPYELTQPQRGMQGDDWADIPGLANWADPNYQYFTDAPIADDWVTLENLPNFWSDHGWRQGQDGNFEMSRISGWNDWTTTSSDDLNRYHSPIFSDWQAADPNAQMRLDVSASPYATQLLGGTADNPYSVEDIFNARYDQGTRSNINPYGSLVARDALRRIAPLLGLTKEDADRAALAYAQEHRQTYGSYYTDGSHPALIADAIAKKLFTQAGRPYAGVTQEQFDKLNNDVHEWQEADKRYDEDANKRGEITGIPYFGAQWLQDIWEANLKHPERGPIGQDPLGTWVQNLIWNEDMDPTMSTYHTPTEKDYEEARKQGINTEGSTAMQFVMDQVISNVATMGMSEAFQALGFTAAEAAIATATIQAAAKAAEKEGGDVNDVTDAMVKAYILSYLKTNGADTTGSSSGSGTGGGSGGDTPPSATPPPSDIPPSGDGSTPPPSKDASDPTWWDNPPPADGTNNHSSDSSTPTSGGGSSSTPPPSAAPPPPSTYTDPYPSGTDAGKSQPQNGQNNKNGAPVDDNNDPIPQSYDNQWNSLPTGANDTPQRYNELGDPDPNGKFDITGAPLNVNNNDGRGLWDYLKGSGSGINDLLKYFGGGNDSNNNNSNTGLMGLLGRVAPAALGAYASNRQSQQLNDLAGQYMGLGAPSRLRYEASYMPGFSMAGDPGYADAMNQSAKATLHGLSMQGNPAGSPNAWAQTGQDLYAKTAFPALQDYRRTNAEAGGLARFAAAAPQVATGAINADANKYGAIGGGIADIFNPPKTLAQQLAELRGSGY